MLAEALYRKNDFFHAARALQGLGPDDAAKLKNYLTLNEAQLESFRDEDPYKFERDAGESTRLPFIKSDPLPVVNVRVNGGPDVAVFIDTGGSELLLDSEFARELNVKPMGSVEGTFSSFNNRLPHRRAHPAQEKRCELEAVRRSGLSFSCPWRGPAIGRPQHTAEEPNWREKHGRY